MLWWGDNSHFPYGIHNQPFLLLFQAGHKEPSSECCKKWGKSSKFQRNSSCLRRAPQPLCGQSLSLWSAGFSLNSGDVLWVGVLCFSGPRRAQVIAARAAAHREELCGESRDSWQWPGAGTAGGQHRHPTDSLWGMTGVTQEGNGITTDWRCVQHFLEHPLQHCSACCFRQGCFQLVRPPG